MAAFDPTTWQAEFDTLLDKLTDDTLASQIRRAVTGSMRQTLAGGNNFPTLSADAIQQATYPDLIWCVDQLLPAGLTFLAGRPKIGKSWLALQLAQAVAGGGQVLGKKATTGRCLYLALEDSPRRIQQRMVAQSWKPGLPVDFVTIDEFRQLGDLRNGGGDKLAVQTEKQGYQLVIIDTFSRAMSGDQRDESDMTAALSPLQEMAQDLGVSVVVVDHMRKNSAGDDAHPLSGILGSTAKAGMLDHGLTLSREHGKAGAKLAISSREMGDTTLDIEFNPFSMAWQSLTGPGGAAVTQAQADILDAVEALGAATLSDLVTATGKDKGNLFKTLQDLVSQHLLIRKGSGKGTTYELP